MIEIRSVVIPRHIINLLPTMLLHRVILANQFEAIAVTRRMLMGRQIARVDHEHARDADAIAKRPRDRIPLGRQGGDDSYGSI